MQYFYQTYWFYALCALAVASGAIGCLVRLCRNKKQMIGLLQERVEMLELHAVQLKEANHGLQRISYVDSLTGVANRRHFEESLNLEWRRASRIGIPVSLIMIDADFFKPFNDTYGHQRGDDCLIRIASTLRNALNRPGDIVARYGGDEFMVLIPGTDAEGAAEMAEAMRGRVESMEIPHEGSLENKVVTISLGVVTGYPTMGLASGGLIAAADKALYQAKGGGRNRLIVSREWASKDYSRNPN